MAIYEASSAGQLSGSANYSAYVYIRQNGQDYATNRTNYVWEVRLLMSGGSAYNNDQDQTWSVSIGGAAAGGTFRLTSAQRYLTNRLLGSGNTWVAHDANGYRPAFASIAYITTAHGSVGSGNSGNAMIDGDRIPKPPSKPYPPTFRSVTPTTIEFNFFNSADNGGSPETGWDMQSATNAAFNENLVTWGDIGSPGIAEGLTPGVTYYIHYRSTNAYGSSAFSDYLVQTTLPAVAPGFAVLPNPSGVSARLSFTAPGGVSGVDRYVWERRVTGTTTPVTTGSSTTAVKTESGLSPGGSYDWRAQAVIGGYESPWSDWLAVVQPQPNISAGDYFDGSYTSADLDYAWLATAGGSASTATAEIPTGWSAVPAGGTAAIWKATAGLFGFYSARATILTDSTGPGGRFGQALTAAADVTTDASYMGSIYVRLSRENRVAAEITWLNAAMAVISRSLGTGVLVPAGTGWTRLSRADASPAGAEFAIVSVIDVVGTGHSDWRGGDIVEMDGAMITLGDLYPYFDGSSPDTAEFRHDWLELENASASTRTSLVSATAAAAGPSLVDPLCPPPPSPPRPPVIPNPCIETSGIWRRTYRNIPAGDISDWQAVVPTFELVTQTATVRQVRIRIYENPLGLPADVLDKGTWLSEQIVSYIPADTVLTIDGVTQRAWASVGDYAAVAADHLLYGSNGAPPVWPVLSCGIGYLISVDMPVEVPQADSFLRGYLTTRS